MIAAFKRWYYYLFSEDRCQTLNPLGKNLCPFSLNRPICELKTHYLEVFRSKSGLLGTNLPVN